MARTLGLLGVRVTEYKLPHRGPASQNSRPLVHGRRQFRDPRPGEFQKSASRNTRFSVLEKQLFRDTDP